MCSLLAWVTCKEEFGELIQRKYKEFRNNTVFKIQKNPKQMFRSRKITLSIDM